MDAYEEQLGATIQISQRRELSKDILRVTSFTAQIEVVTNGLENC